MPVFVEKKLKPLGQREFMALDHEVTSYAFQIHNRYGSLCDEKIYADELAYLCSEKGLTACREVEIKVSHQSLSKSYYMDLVVEGTSIYELKAHHQINPAHEQQLLNYLLLTDIQHGKLINFGGASVQNRFVSTKVDSKKRKSIRLKTDSWIPCCERGKKLPGLLLSLLEDWGGFLSANLYREAISAILSKGTGLLGTVDLYDGDRCVGSQKQLLLAPDVVLCVTGDPQNSAGFRKHLKRMLDHSSVSAIQWLNFAHHDVILETLKKSF